MPLTDAQRAYRREYYRVYRALHPEQFKEYGRKWRAQDPERFREANRRYLEKHPDANRQAGAKYREANRERIREMHRAKYANDPELRAARSNYAKSRRYAMEPEYKAQLIRKESDRNRLQTTGWTPEQYAEAMQEQEGQCAICGGAPSGRGHAADHDHTTGRRRKLLCHRCNTALGLLKDDASLLLSAHIYLLTAS